MSRHWKIEVHVVTPGEDDDEDEAVQRYAASIESLGRALGIEARVGEVERT